MFEKGLKELELISQAAGARADYVQGGGGNTSVKLDDKLMAVKASGFKLNQISTTEGFVVVNYKDIKGYHEKADLNSGTDYEKESIDFVRRSIVELEGIKSLRPSVEAGFHSILKKYVIHTHPVYANILCCSVGGMELADKILAPAGLSWLWVPYINPGFSLTLSIMGGIGKMLSEGGRFPDALFLENHGLVVNSDDPIECIKLHDEVNQRIMQYFGISKPYPEIVLEESDKGNFVSKTAYLRDFFRGSTLGPEFFSEVALYPDQLVYLSGNISINNPGNKLDIDTSDGRLTYNTSSQEALTMEETLLGYIYVIRKVEENGLKLKTMTAEGANFINNWESEKYRKGITGK